MIPALALRGVDAGYGPITVLRGVELVVPPRAVVALLGPNGAGKTTVLRVASGQLAPSRGCVHVAGVHVNGTTSAQLARAGVCAIPEGRGVFANLTVDEHLGLFAPRGARLDAVRDAAFARFPALARRRGQLAGTLSGGEQQMLALARACVTAPAVLLVDELARGLAPRVVEELYRVVSGLAAEGASVLLAEQFPRAALAVADHAAVLAAGRVVATGTPEAIGDGLARAYLGGAA